MSLLEIIRKLESPMMDQIYIAKEFTKGDLVKELYKTQKWRMRITP